VSPDSPDPLTIDREDPSAPSDPTRGNGSAGPPRGGSGGPPGTAQPRRSNKVWAIEGAVFVVFLAVVYVVLRHFIVQTFYIPSGSMEPTLNIGDRIVVSKLSYDVHSVHRGDIVVFSRPPQENCGGEPVNDLVKRVIGLPGETISLTKGARSYVVINGKQLNETWLPNSVQGVTEPGPAGTPYNLSRPYLIPPNDYFMMGDNRTQSCDSRWWGPISSSLIVGKVDLRVWPISGFKFFF
jgi:signal peptidase I